MTHIPTEEELKRLFPEEPEYVLNMPGGKQIDVVAWSSVVPVLRQLIVSSRSEVLHEVAHEREIQKVHGFTPEHDDRHGALHVVREAQHRLASIQQVGYFEMRQTLIEVAALAVAAVETLDRALPANNCEADESLKCLKGGTFRGDIFVIAVYCDRPKDHDGLCITDLPGGRRYSFKGLE